MGHSSDVAGGIQGSLSVDPARPQGGKATVRVDITLVRTGIDKRDADMRGKPYLLPQLRQVGPRDTLVFLQASPLLWLAVT